MAVDRAVEYINRASERVENTMELSDLLGQVLKPWEDKGDSEGCYSMRSPAREESHGNGKGRQKGKGKRKNVTFAAKDEIKLDRGIFSAYFRASSR